MTPTDHLLMDIELQTRDGQFVAVVEVLPMQPPEVVTWGSRVFTLHHDPGVPGMPIYREAFALPSLTPSPGKPRPLGQAMPCRGCGKELKAENLLLTLADGCPCNSPRGVNHGIVPANVCTCVECDPAQTGSARLPGSAVVSPTPVDRSARDVVGASVAQGEPDTTVGPNGQHKGYLILSDEERAKGFVRPVRRSYVHVGLAGPRYPLRDLTAEERERHPGEIKYEAYPPEETPKIGRLWSQHDLDSVGKGCGSVTTMGVKLAETYARDPWFYGSTFCVRCGTHPLVGVDGEFIWSGTTERVGT